MVDGVEAEREKRVSFDFTLEKVILHKTERTDICEVKLTLFLTYLLTH